MDQIAETNTKQQALHSLPPGALFLGSFTDFEHASPLWRIWRNCWRIRVSRGEVLWELGLFQLESGYMYAVACDSCLRAKNQPDYRKRVSIERAAGEQLPADWCLLGWGGTFRVPLNVWGLQTCVFTANRDPEVHPLQFREVSLFYGINRNLLYAVPRDSPLYQLNQYVQEAVAPTHKPGIEIIRDVVYRIQNPLDPDRHVRVTWEGDSGLIKLDVPLTCEATCEATLELAGILQKAAQEWHPQ